LKKNNLTTLAFSRSTCTSTIYTKRCFFSSRVWRPGQQLWIPGSKILPWSGHGLLCTFQVSKILSRL